MNSSSDISKYIRVYMADLLRQYNLSVIKISDQEVLLRCTAYCIYAHADMESVTLTYFDLMHEHVAGYDIYFFLLHKRYSLLKPLNPVPVANSHGQYIEAQIQGLASHLREAGRDILSGSREWLSSYPWPKIAPPKKLFSSGLICRQ